MSSQQVRVNRLILEVVENQLKSLAPVQTKETFDRLLERGYSEEDAKHLIGAAVIAEMRLVVSEGKPFQEKRFISMLSDLPQLP